MSDVATSTPTASRRKLPAPLLLIGGILVIPTLLTVLFNSWSEPDAEAYVRMAFASVAGWTVAIVTVIAVLTSRIRQQASTVAAFTAIAIIVTLWSLHGINHAAALLLARLGQLQ